MTKKKTRSYVWLLVILAFPLQLSAIDDNQHEQDPIRQSVVTGPIISSALIQQDGPRRRFGTQRADKTPLNAAKVRKAIQRGVRYLIDNQQQDGSWKDIHDGGTSALCTLALLNAADLPKDPFINDPTIRRAMEHLSSLEATGTYVVSLRIMAMTTADPQLKKFGRQVQADVDWLIKTQVGPDAPSAGGWHYGTVGRGDASNTQFALLGLHEASKAGIKVPQKTWELAQSYWLRSERKGGFSYYVVNDTVARGSMTCAGIASLLITQENLIGAGQLVNGDFANCCRLDELKVQIDKSFGWLADHYTVRANPHDRRQDRNTKLYFLYGLERAGRFAGRRFVGENDWYRDGAKELLNEQHPLNDFWSSAGSASGTGEGNPLIGTSFALLFLSKGKRPVVIGKYDHGAEDWDLHPKGVHYLTRRLEQAWDGVKLNWQTVQAKNSTTDDLLAAPVLFMSGKEFLDLKPTEKENLKEYLENGGFLFAEACQGDGCGDNVKYDKAFRALMAEIFPDSRLEPLPINHPIWTSHYSLLGGPAAMAERPLLGLQACCRTSVVYCPKNLSCYWELDRPSILDANNVSIKLKQRVEQCIKIGVNVVAYATDRARLREKGETPKIAEKGHELLAERVLIMPKLQHSGGADDAPNAWSNVLRNVQTNLGLEIKTDKKMIAATTESLADYPFVFMHGRNKFTFSNKEREAIMKHLEYGGLIFADSICASQAFTDSFRSEMNIILRKMGTRLNSIPSDSPLWTDQYGYVIKQVTMRTKTKGGSFQDIATSPQLEGAQLDGRWAVIFSPIDLSCALENSAKSQCTGYSHDDALRISTNVIMYSLLGD